MSANLESIVQKANAADEFHEDDADWDNIDAPDQRGKNKQPFNAMLGDDAPTGLPANKRKARMLEEEREA